MNLRSIAPPARINTTVLRRPLGFVMRQIAARSGGPLFSTLLRQRNETLWKGNCPVFGAPEDCENTLLGASADECLWFCCDKWQRKLSNKLNAKAFAVRCGAMVAELYWSGTSPHQIPFDLLPVAYVIKISTGWCSREVLPVRTGVNVFDGQQISPADARAHFTRLLASGRYAKARLLAEELLSDPSSSDVPKDYKCYCFGGRAEFIQVVRREAGSPVKHVWYSRDWTILPSQMQLNADRGEPEPPPLELKALLDCADRLSTEYRFPFVRVDLYLASKGVVFGEFTHAPNAGSSIDLYTPFANVKMGDLWSRSAC